MTEAQANTTRFCARVIGPLMVVIGAIVIVRAGDLALLIPAILQDGPLAFVTGVVLIAAHHHWNNAAAIAISLLGVITIVRSVTLMFAPSVLAGLVHTALTGGPGVIITGAIAALIGAWLSFVGWFAKPAARS